MIDSDAFPEGLKAKSRPLLKDLPSVLETDRPKGCESCPFSKKKVGSRGPEDSPFVIVGESPGNNELLKGQPFVGASGEVLEAVFEELGLYDLGVEPYITNALQCLPFQPKTPQAMSTACMACQSRLHTEIAAYPRKIIVALGAAAAWSLTGNYSLKITQDRGKLFPSPLSELGIVTAVHPAFLMRQGAGYLNWKKDLQ
jgi:DNA polymerase